MKRVLFISALLTGTILCAFAQDGKRITGVIRELTGEVELKHTASSAFIKAKAGDTVAADTIVSTGFKSIAIIEVGSSTITARPLTRLSLAEIQSVSSTETLNMNLQTGRVKVDVKPPAGAKANVSLQSPIATASVRGTSFEFDTWNLTVKEGGVAYKGNKGMEILIPAGMASSIDADGKAVDPLDDADISAAKSIRRPSMPSYDVDLTFNW